MNRKYHILYPWIKNLCRPAVKPTVTNPKPRVSAVRIALENMESLPRPKVKAGLSKFRWPGTVGDYDLLKILGY